MIHKAKYLLAILMLFTPLMLETGAVHAQSYETVVVGRGDTLSKLARRYCTTWRAIYNMNRNAIGPNPNRLDVGTVLTIANYCSDDGGHVADSGGVFDRGPRTGATGTFNAPNYTVAWGDNLDDIGRRFGVSVDLLRQINDMWGDSIFAGMRLVIPGTGGGVGPQPPVAPSPERVRFAPGAIAASRTGETSWGNPKPYVLSASGGQVMELYTFSHGDPLAVSIIAPNNTNLAVNGVNYAVQNSLWLTLPMSGDYVVTVGPAVMPEHPAVNFDITFVIR